MTKRPDTEKAKVIAEVFDTYIAIHREGLGRGSDISEDEKARMRAELLKNIDDVFGLYAEVKLAKVLGIYREWVIDKIQAWPEGWAEEA